MDKINKTHFTTTLFSFFFVRMNSNGDTVYAVIIVCVVVLLSLVSCFCLRYWRRAKRNNVEQALSQQQQQQQQPTHEWQQLRSVVLHSTETGEDIQPVLSMSIIIRVEHLNSHTIIIF